MLSVVVPAHDEAGELPRTIACLRAGLAGLGVDHEIVVVDNASTDDTAGVARASGARVVHEPYRQISRARNAGAAAATGEWLLFVDADTWPATELLGRAVDQLRAGGCGGGALVAMETLPNRVYRWGLRTWNRVSRRFGWAAGCFVFARRDGFEAIGGFDERLFAGDEVFFSRRLRRWGRARGRAFVVLDAPRVRTSTRKAYWFSPLQHLLTMLLVVLCPWAMRSRRLMGFWYRRPGR